MLDQPTGVLKDLPHERLPILDVCNELTGNNAAFPAYLHDAPSGWDVLIQQRYIIDMAIASPVTFRSMLEFLPMVAAEARSKFAANNIQGRQYEFNPSDIKRLLDRSLM